jgi:hypothetical protein
MRDLAKQIWNTFCVVMDKIVICKKLTITMKRALIILIVLVSFCPYAKSQQIFVNGQNLSTLKNVNYVTIKAQKTWMATRLSAFLDYGQGTSEREQEITDASKKSLFFKSKVEIFNLLDKNGWELVDTYEESKEGKSYVLHVFRRKK